MKTFVAGVCLVVCAIPGVAAAQTKPKPCPFAPETLSAVLGQTFAAGVEEPGIVGGASCAYRGKTVKLTFVVSPFMGPTAEQTRKLMNPRGTVWTPVAGDPDKAVTVTMAPSVPPFPSISYERGGYVVDLHITGEGGSDIAAWRGKLLKLPRVP